MGVLDLLFGEKIIKNDDFFGRIESDKTRKKDLSKSVNWNFHKNIKPFNKETFFILDGDFNNINPTQKIELQRFIEDFETVYSFEVDKLIKSKSEFAKFTNWRTDFYISFISPLPKSNTDFEINFEAVDESNESYFFIELWNGILKNISI